MWRRARLDIPQLSLQERVAAADRAQAIAEQDEAGDWHDGTPYGCRPWWESVTDTAATADDADGS